MIASPITFLRLTCMRAMGLSEACCVNIANMYDRAEKIFLSRECLAQRLELAAAACGCTAQSAIKQVPVIAVYETACDAISVKSLKQVIEQRFAPPASSFYFQLFDEH
jgi:hypothetical protein